jgi:hypothetical protein
MLFFAKSIIIKDGIDLLTFRFYGGQLSFDIYGEVLSD